MPTQPLTVRKDPPGEKEEDKSEDRTPPRPPPTTRIEEDSTSAPSGKTSPKQAESCAEAKTKTSGPDFKDQVRSVSPAQAPGAVEDKIKNREEARQKKAPPTPAVASGTANSSIGITTHAQGPTAGHVFSSAIRDGPSN